MRWVLALGLLVTACGRRGFDARSDASGGGGDDGGGDDGGGGEGQCVPSCATPTSIDTCAGITPCSNGCVPGPPPTCSGYAFVPSNGIDPSILDTLGLQSTSLAPGEAAVINTDTGYITVDGNQYRAAGPGVNAGIYYEQVGNLAVFGALSGDYPATSTIRVVGTRALVLLAKGDVRVDADFVLSAGLCPSGTMDPWCGGPGGGSGGQGNGDASGCGPGGRGVSSGSTGGGGGALGTAGARGGQEVGGGGSAGGAAGAIVGCPLTPTTMLVGGSGGGAGGNGGNGGGGGGALQLVVYGRLTGTGRFLAAGTGGRPFGSGGGGGGGGAGGTILIEALEMSFSGVLAANGGAGGEGEGSTVGGNGLPSTMPATCGTSGGNRGGSGGALGTAPTVGHSGTNDTGGGGAAVGVILLRAGQLDLTGAVVSPAHGTLPL